MTAAAAEAGRLLGVAYYRRKYPKLRRAMELIAAGTIGRPVMGFASAHDWFIDEDGLRPWLLDPAMAGGGPLYDTACHRIDVFNLLFGRPAAVTAQLSNVVHQGAVEDSATVLIDYESGARAIVDTRRHSRVSRDELRIIGTEGELDLTPLNGAPLKTPAGVEQWPAHANLHYPIVEDFVSAVVAGTPLASSGETALFYRVGDRSGGARRRHVAHAGELRERFQFLDGDPPDDELGCFGCAMTVKPSALICASATSRGVVQPDLHGGLAVPDEPCFGGHRPSAGFDSRDDGGQARVELGGRRKRRRRRRRQPPMTPPTTPPMGAERAKCADISIAA